MKNLRHPWLLVCAACIAPALGSALPAAASHAERTFELAFTVGATHLSAVNSSDAAVALVLQGRADTRREIVVIPAGGRIDARFAPSLLRELELIVVSRGELGPIRSAPFALDALRERAFEACWLDLEPAGVSAWVRSPEAFKGIDSRGRDNGASTGASNVLAPIHVPVITPHDGRGVELPPRLERHALPPV